MNNPFETQTVCCQYWSIVLQASRNAIGRCLHTPRP